MGKLARLLALGLLSVYVSACGDSGTSDGLGSADSTEGEASAAQSVFRAGLHHPGVFEGPAPQNLARIVWTFQADGTVRSTPAVAGSRIYVGSGDGHLYALDRQTGVEVWRFDAESPVPSVPAVDGGRVFFTTRGGTAFALSVDTGEQLWSVDTGPDIAFPWGGEGWDYWTGSVTVVGDRVVFGAGDGVVRALEAATGTVIWEHQTQGRIRATPAVHDGHALVGSFDGTLYVLDLADGSVAWTFETDGASMSSEEWGFDRVSIQSSVAVVDDVVYLGARDANLYALDRASGEELWRTNDETAWVVASPAVAGGVVYSATSSSGIVYAVDAASGNELWRTFMGGPVFGSPAVVGETVVVTDLARYVSVLDRATGDILWRYRTGGPIKSSPVVVDGTVYVGSDDGRVYALGSGAEPTPRRAVFWDEGFTSFTTLSRAEAIMGHFRTRGYEVLDAAGLADFMESQIGDEGRSVVVFALDWVPAQVAPGAPPGSAGEGVGDGDAGVGPSTFRQYLESGGKVVWLGYPPLAIGRDPVTGAFADYDLARSGVLLDVPQEFNGDDYGVTSTRDGAEWGLPQWWTGFGGIDPSGVTLTLGLDENGRASAWVKEYGGPPGTGFVHLQGGLTETNLDAVASVAEYGILR